MRKAVTTVFSTHPPPEKDLKDSSNGDDEQPRSQAAQSMESLMVILAQQAAGFSTRQKTSTEVNKGTHTTLEHKQRSVCGSEWVGGVRADME